MAEQERRSGRQEIEFYVNDQPVKTDEEELTVERILEQAGEATGDTAEGEKLLIELREGQRVEHANLSERIHIKANSRFEVRSREPLGREEEEPAPARGGGGREGQPRGGQGGAGRPDVPREGTREYESTVGQPSARTAQGQAPSTPGERRGTSGGMAPGTTGQAGPTGTAGQQGLERQSKITSTEGAAQERVGEQEEGKESRAEDDHKRKQKQQER